VKKKRVNKVVLAYSGGLDTSVILKWIEETYGCEVITVTADVGQGEDLSVIEAKALATGASKAYVLDLKEEFLTQYAFPVLRSGAVYERKYLLGTSFARPLIAKYQVEIAKREGADAVAHGCTGKGNDQVRFELTYKALAPELTVIAPWREWDLSGREALLEYAASRGIPVAQSKENIYSRDQNLWHLSHEGGELEDPWQAPSERVYQITASPQAAPDQPEEIVIGFEHGYPVSLNGERLPPVTLMERLNAIGGQHGIGRIDLVENRLVGMKSRGVYEQSGATILSVAHKELEHLTLDRETMHFKDQLALKYAELVYYGLWYTPLREALDAFVDVTQRTVTGEVRLMLYKGNCIPTGRRSPYSLYSMELATFGADAIYDQRDAEGFINLFGLPLEVAALLAKQRSTSS
jgi:argininosuccinate synthase